MTEVPDSWFDVLDVDADDVARVGLGLAEYAAEHETVRLTQVDAAAVERLLMQATTLADAASLIVLVDSAASRELFAHAATILETVGAPHAWTFGLASQGAWQPSRDPRIVRTQSRPGIGMSELAALYYDQDRELGYSDSAWETASAFRDGDGQGWSSIGVPAKMFAEFAEHARENDLDAVITTLDHIIRRSDEAIRLAQERDRWHWRRFVADVPLIAPELLALGSVASRIEASLVHRVQDREMSPARVAVMAGMRTNDDPPSESVRT